MKPIRFNIYEIEHRGGETHALSELRRIGATEIQIVARDDDSIRIACQLPDNIRSFDDLENAVDLCL